MAMLYFIDHNAPDDSASGTSKSAPWKRCPGMVGFSHAYSPAIGDRFHFKGNVEWPFSVFPLTIVTGGAAPAGNFREYNTDTYNYFGGAPAGDKTWFAGSSWSKPRFNFAGLSGNGILTSRYIQIDNIDMFDLEGVGGTRHDTSSVPHKTINYGAFSTTVAFVNCQNGGYARISYCDIHEFRNFQRYVVASASPDGVFGGSPAQPGVEMDHNRLFNSTIPERSCNATYGISYVSFNEAFQISNFCGQGFGFMHDNYAHDFNRTDIPFSDGSGSNSNTGTHGNVFQTFSTSTIYNNIIANVAGVGFLEDGVTPDQGWVSPIDVGGSATIYNNVLWNVGGQTAIGAFTNFLGGFPFLKVYNNILGPGAFGIHPAAEGGIGLFDVRNNIIITDGTANPVSYSGTITTFINDHNPVLSTATAAALGMTTANRFKPTVSSPTIVDAGVDLSSTFNYDVLNNTRSVPWEIGAYDWNGINDPHPNGTITSPAPSVAVTQGNSLSFSGSGTSPTNSLPLTYTWDFGGSGASQSNLQNPGNITFNTLGTFTVTFTVKDSANLSDPTPATCTVTVNPVVSNPVLSVTPSFNFGFVDVNTPSNGVLVVTNTGTGTLIGAATSAAPFSITSGANYSLAANASQNVFIRYQQSISGSIDSGSVNFTGAAGGTSVVTGRTPFDLIFRANQGVISAPFAVGSDFSVFQSIETTTPSNGGLDYFEFVAPSAGDYTITASVNAPSGGNNSFFINVDAEPTDPTMIWDIVTLTTGFENRQVSWRGNGAFDAPQFAPKTFTLSQGKHKLYLRGREANTKIATITFNSVTAPVNQAPIATLTSDVNSGVGPLLVTFTLNSSDADGTVASGVLDYGDGNPTLSINSPVLSSTRTHTYASVGSLTTYAATWTITDNGAATNTATRNITISPTPPPPPNQPPIATISATPLSGNSPLPVTFTLGASDPDDSVASAVIDYGDGVTETITNPSASLSRSHTYSNAGPGDVTRTSTYTATDTHSATGTANASITISPPIPAAISVLPTSLSFGSISLTTTRDLPLVVKNVGGQTLTGGLSTSAPFSITTSPATYSLAPGASNTFNIRFTPIVYSTTSNGTLTLTGSGGTSVALSGSSLANVAPIVTLDSPTNGATFTVSVAHPLNLVISASASDSDGTITKVEFYNGVTKLGEDLVSPYSFSTQYTTPGVHVITAKATDSGGATTTSSPATLTLTAPIVVQPTVSITSPTQGASFAFNAPISISVTSSSVVKVDYYSDAMKIGQDTQSPHNFIWSGASIGAHTLTATVTDNLGNTKTSNPIGIVVLASPPSSEPVPFIIYVNPS